MNIVQKYNEHFESKIQVYPQHKNRASSIGHPCSRFLVHSRLDWDKKEKHGLDLELIFKEGRHQEDNFISDCREAGIMVHESQRSFSWDLYEITGHIDGTIEKIPFEFKSMSPFQWEKLNDVNDIRTSDKYYVRGYYDQMQTYLLMMNSEKGFLIFKNKVTGKLKQFEVHLDFAYAETLIKKIEKINEMVKNREYPERIDDRDVCKQCTFRSLCLPDEGWDQVQIVFDEKILDLLEKRDQLKSYAAFYDKIDKEIKKLLPEPAGEYLYGGKFSITKKTFKTTVYEIPKDIKDKYAEKVERSRVNITNLEDKQNND